MINISKLYCDEVTPGDWLRYGKTGSGERAGEVVPKKASERLTAGLAKTVMTPQHPRLRQFWMIWRILVCLRFYFQVVSL